MTTPCPRLAACLGLALLVSWPLTILAAPAPAKPDAGARTLTPQEREQVRISKIMQWAAKTGASDDQVARRIFEPVLTGNVQDQERNRRMAKEFADLATQARQAGQSKQAERFRTLDELFTECAKENGRVVAAFKGPNMVELRNSLARLRQLDQRIEEVSGKKVERSWAVMDEMLATMGAVAARQSNQGTEASPTKPAKPAKPNRPAKRP